nr:hypothetical protein [Tanacetum cinerariifolium]
PAPPPSPIRSLGYRAAMIQLRDEAAFTSHSPPSQLLSASRREDRPQVTLPPQKRLDIALGPRYEEEARMSREAWTRATDASDLVHGEVISLRTTVIGQISEIRELQAADRRSLAGVDHSPTGTGDSLAGTEIKELQAADRRRQIVILELLRIDHTRSTEIAELRTALQGQVTALQGQVTALQAQVTTL